MLRKYNVYKRKDGRWEGRIPHGKRKNGKRRYKYVFAKSREEVIRRIDAIRDTEQVSVCCSVSLSSAFKSWFSGAKHKIKESTAANYLMKAEKHILPVFGDMAVDAITATSVNHYIDDKQKQGLSNRYICDIIVLMKSIFKYVVRTYHVSNPMDGVCPPRKEKCDVQLLSTAEQKTLQDYIAQNQTHTSVGVAVTMGTGLRIGELCALQGRDIDLEKRILTVSKTMQRIQCPTDTAKTKVIITDPKSETSKRQIPIPECLVGLLCKFKLKDDEYLLSGTDKPVEPRTMQYRFRRILLNAKLPSVHFHSLRHAFASNCVELGFDIKSLSEILGHSSVEITLNRYVHSSFEQKQKFMDWVVLNF